MWWIIFPRSLATMQKGVLIHQRNDELREEVVYISRMVYTPETIRSEPVIQPLPNQDENGITDLENNSGDVMIRGLFEKTKRLHNICKSNKCRFSILSKKGCECGYRISRKGEER